MLKMLCSCTSIDFQICPFIIVSLACFQEAVCNCNWAPETIFCQKCGKSFVGRRRMSSERHRNTIHLMNCAYCVFWKRQLLEVCFVFFFFCKKLQEINMVEQIGSEWVHFCCWHLFFSQRCCPGYSTSNLICLRCFVVAHLLISRFVHSLLFL